MGYLSASFVGLAIVGMLLFYGLPKRFRGTVLLAVSLLFYASLFAFCGINQLVLRCSPS